MIEHKLVENEDGLFVVRYVDGKLIKVWGVADFVRLLRARLN